MCIAGSLHTDSRSAADLYSWIDRHLRCWTAERFTGFYCAALAYQLQSRSTCVRGFLGMAELRWADVQLLGEHWPAAARGQGCTCCLSWQTHDGYRGGGVTVKLVMSLLVAAALLLCFTSLLRRSLARREFPGSSKMSRPGVFHIARPT